jgi:Heterokaryon incompatibility protein (HET)
MAQNQSNQCKTCLDLKWELFPNDWQGQIRQLQVGCRDILSSFSSGCQYCRLIWLSMNAASKGRLESDSQRLQLSATAKSWAWIKLQRDRPLHIYAYPHFGTSQGGWYKECWKLYCEIFFAPSLTPRPIESIGAARIVQATLYPETRREVLRSWLRRCDGSHDRCQQTASLQGSAVLPPRLLELGPQTGRAIRLIESEGMHRRYATVSHCWGDHGPLMTTKATLPFRLHKIDWEQLPRSFQDAVTVALEQDIRYLWIDSICIIQDDKLDWEWHTKNMAYIYANTAFNIGVTRAKNSSEGCFGDRCVETFQINFGTDRRIHTAFARAPLSMAHDAFTGKFRSEADHFQGNLEALYEAAPLLRRGWVFQERLLAPRTVHFHSSEMIWECRTEALCECDGLDNMSKDLGVKWTVPQTLASPPATYSPTPADQQNILVLWQVIIVDYMKLTLTYSRDRLAALAGLAQQMQAYSGLQYCAGFLFANPSDLMPQLAWLVDTTGWPDGLQPCRLRNSKIASWSWASMGPIYCGLTTATSQQMFYPSSEVISLVASDRVDAASLTAEGWRLHVKGPVANVTAIFDRFGGRTPDYIQIRRWNDIHKEGEVPNCEFFPDSLAEPWVGVNPHSWGHVTMGVEVLLLGTFPGPWTIERRRNIRVGLVLADSGMGPNLRERLGVVICKDNSHLFEGAEVQDITLV